MTTTIERLGQLLDEKDAEIDKLNERIEGLEQSLRGARSGWSLHVDLPKEQTLPVPRLELIWEADADRGWKRAVAKYRLVYRHFLDHCVAVPLGSTTVEGGRGDPPMHGAFIDLPIRDGAHIISDMKCLGLRAFAVVGDVVQELHEDEFERRREARERA